METSMASIRPFTLALTSGLLCLVSISSGAEPATVDADSVVDYVLGCRKHNGAFGPRDQLYTDAAWNYPAVRTLQLLGVKIDKPEQIVRHGLDSPPGHVGYGHWLFFHQHQLLHRLNVATEIDFANRNVHVKHQGYEVRYYGSPFGTEGDTFFNAPGGSHLDPRDAAATELGYYNLSSLYYLLSGLKASGRRPANSDELAAFVTERQAPCGGFVDVRTKAGQPIDEETHIAATFFAVSSLQLLGHATPRPADCVRHIQSCQTQGGGFLYSPNENAPGNYADIYYTWAALHTLQSLEAKPVDVGACGEWINALQNADGGFGDQPTWRSRLYSTYYAIDSLALVHGDAKQGVVEKRCKPPEEIPIPAGLSIYQGLFKTPLCTPADLPGLHARGLDLIAVKSEDFEQGAALQRSAGAEQEAILCLEAYPHRALRSGQTEIHHVGNILLDPRWNDKQRSQWDRAHAAGQKGLPWRSYQKQVIEPIEQLGSLIYPEQDFEMEFAYSAYDDGVHQAHGYNAMLAGFNWSPRDFVRVFPWRERYVDKLPPIADADAHGDLAKWSPQLDHTRHLFLAPGPTLAHFQQAAREGNVVCVIKGATPTAPKVTYYGRPAAVRYVKEREKEWMW